MNTLRRRRWMGGGLLALVAIVGGSWLWRLDHATQISSDVLDLIPASERSPELTLIRQLASHAEARTLLMELTLDGRPAPAEAAAHFVFALRSEPAIEQVVSFRDQDWRDRVAGVVHAERMPLLFPIWLEHQRARFGSRGRSAADFPSWLAEETVAGLAKFLGEPEALPFQDLLPSDPLLLVPALAQNAQASLALSAPPTPAGETPPALVWAQIAASPLSEEGQKPVFAALERALEKARAAHPRLQLAYTGVARFAATSRVRIEREVALLNLVSLAAVLAVALAFLRHLRRGLHLLPPILFSVLGAWVCTTLIFDRVHVLVFVVGSLLTGVAIDYGFYIFMQPPETAGEDYWAKVRRLLPALLASCLTTVAGFALLLFSELPLIRQLGVFVGSGLIAALAAALVYFSTVRDCFLETRSFRGGLALGPGIRRGLRRGLVVIALAGLPGLVFLDWRDDVRDLEIPAPELRREDSRLRALFGDDGNRTVYLSYGATPGEAREALERLGRWLGAGRRTSLAPIVPTPAAEKAAWEFVRSTPDWPVALQTALERAGFEPAAFDPFFAAYADYAQKLPTEPPGAALARLHAGLSGPLALLFHPGDRVSWFITLAERRSDGAAPPPETRSVAASQLQSLNKVFSRYRRSALWFSLGGLGLVGGGVLLTYGWRAGGRIFAIPCGTCLATFGWFGWTGVALNLFHLLGAFLGVCLLHNYSIFSATSAFRREPPPASVRLSALTTAASFGVLALSSIPVVHALGATVSVMVLVALLFIEFEHLSPLGHAER